MASLPRDSSRKNRRATIFVTGPNLKTTIGGGYEEDKEKKAVGIRRTLQDEYMNELANRKQLAVHTSNSIELLVQLVINEFELMRYHIREAGLRMRNYISQKLQIDFERLRKFFENVFARSVDTKYADFQREKAVIFNELLVRPAWKMPKYTLNDVEEVMTTDDLEEGVFQRRMPKWEKLPIRVKPPRREDDDFCEFQRMNVPMTMTIDEEEDRLSMPSTRTVMTSEDQMAAIQAQLAMLSRQLMAMQQQGVAKGTASSRASSRRGYRIEKRSSLDVPTSSNSSSEDEGKGTSVCSPAFSRKTVELPLTTSSVAPEVIPVIAPLAAAPPPPPPPPPLNFAISKPAVFSAPKTVDTASNLPPKEAVTSDRPYLIDIANGRKLLKTVIKSPNGSPMSSTRIRRPVSSFEAALQRRFRGFHGDTSFSEQDDAEDEDGASNWDE